MAPASGEQQIEGVNVVQLAVRNVQLPRLGDQPVGELRVNAPVAHLVGIGQRRSPHRFAKPHVIEFRGLSRQADFDIAQALPIGQLRKCHRPVLLDAAQRSDPMPPKKARRQFRGGTAGRVKSGRKPNCIEIAIKPM